MTDNIEEKNGLMPGFEEPFSWQANFYLCQIYQPELYQLLYLTLHSPPFKVGFPIMA